MLPFISYPYNSKFWDTTFIFSPARLIKLGKEKGLKRQVFSILLWGFDQHGGQPIQHPQRLRGVSIAIDKFMRSMENFGLSDSVTLFNVSEFSRAIGSSSYGTSWLGWTLLCSWWSSKGWCIW